MKKFNSIVLALAGLFISTAAFSQDATNATEETAPTFTMSGSVDVFARSAFGYKSVAPLTSFANGKGFSLGMANLIASYAGDKVGFTADLVFGPRGQQAVFGSEQGIINQMFVYYKLSDAVTLNMGQFNTFLGYEVISPAVNFHYSTSYMFSYGPFNHTGLRADFSFGDGMVAKLAVMNPTDIVEWNPVNTYTIGAQIGKTSDAGGVWLNFLYGDQDGKLEDTDPYEDEDGNLIGSRGTLFQADLTLGYNLGEKFYLGVNTSYQTIGEGQAFTGPGDLEDGVGETTSFLGFAVYPKLTLSDAFALGLRAEYFSVTKEHLTDVIGLDDDGDGNVMAFTLSGNYKVNGLTIIPEIRMDKMSEDFFADKDGEGTDMLPSVTLAAVYKF